MTPKGPLKPPPALGERFAEKLAAVIVHAESGANGELRGGATRQCRCAEQIPTGVVSSAICLRLACRIASYCRRISRPELVMVSVAAL